MGFLARFVVVIAASVVTAGCFQPLYGEYSASNGGTRIAQAVSAVDVLQIDAPTGTDVRALRSSYATTYSSAYRAEAAVDRRRTRCKSRSPRRATLPAKICKRDFSSSNIYSITATYQLTDLRTGKVVLSDKAYAPVSYDIPGEQQRFASTRALRDSENRAAQLVADNIRGRLASFFVAGSQPL